MRRAMDAVVFALVGAVVVFAYYETDFPELRMGINNEWHECQIYPRRLP